ncbi:hypothetical protein [Sphingobium yanoikuyae]|uniref:hypothetical protein n=1 Tax=Sphingobium yanoikuyae TaxID=13690 RepID=UPI0022DE165D|nr:hypothetical protein [Sphingobium yanoikuyae]WBQ16301.1 hypothetical protein PAE53_20745 [Sphingobium yanoikuyae]
MSVASTLDLLDFAGVEENDAQHFRAAILRGENFQGYIPSDALDFIVRNYRALAQLQALEPAWLDCYVHSSHFSTYGIETIKAIFDACDRQRLRLLRPITQIAGDRATLFRGCAGPVHTMGMSWTSSLDKAIWYAAYHATYYDLTDCAVYVTTMPVSEIYCCLDHYDHDCVAHPLSTWRVYVPAEEFRLDRPRESMR